MQFQHLASSAGAAEADVLAITVFGSPDKDATFKAISGQVGGGLAAAAKDESFEGKSGQMLMFNTTGRVVVDPKKPLLARRILVLGGGGRKDYSPTLARDLVAAAVGAAHRVGGKRLAFLVPAGHGGAEALQNLVEGAVLGTYRFNRYLTSDDAKKPCQVETVVLVSDGKKPTAAQARGIDAALRRGQVVAATINRARDLVNEPAAVITPVALAAEAEAIAKRHKTVTVKVLGPKQCAELGMGMFLAVGQGSEQESRFIHLTYKPAKPAKKKLKRVALIGKGVTFDSGGYSLKPSSSMEDMKVDMSGAAAVISAMDALAQLDCPHEVHAIAACCENLVSGRAYKLGDVLKSMDGTTVEINNTDAEGRLTLGDAITYARTKVEPDEMFDFATLTGACMVALGPHTAGVMSDHDSLARSWMSAAHRAGEDMWRLPLNPRLREQLKSPIADMRNTGDRFGGAITAGLFLKTFAKDTPWVHVDIAGPASTSAVRPATPKGGTGFAVASILEYLR
ncbi:MAG: leucyl aminopeptidase [Kofleriaceae bacterium]|jgi:leucyl aminopeptidase|nr:leucyl aminopeptidase [Kofleriaceae bacterium]MBP6837193.1 leucyl aminopeptidase [Kofleriaceae bacterium]MBP9203688.1 leucyl aminopeptidase [Kofleriaceae bacterium]